MTAEAALEPTADLPPADLPPTEPPSSPAQPTPRAADAPAHPDPETAQAGERRPPTDVPRVYAKTRNVWVRGKPTSQTQWIGFIWFGDSVKLRDPAPVPGPGCSGSWYAVEPRGYVCVDGERATLDPLDPVVTGLYALGPDPDSPTPHPHYGESKGAERYVSLPTPAHQSRREWDYRLQKKRLVAARSGGPLDEALFGVDVELRGDPLTLPELPRTLQMGHRTLKPTSAVAWTRQVVHDERVWLLTEDLTWVPKDRVVAYDPVDFQGVHLSGELMLPHLAFIRGSDKRSYRPTPDGAFEFASTYARLSAVELTGQTKESTDGVFHETRRGDWLRQDDAVIPQLRAKAPWGSPVLGEDDLSQGTGKRRWIDVSILGGYLVVYEGVRPVFATLIAPGRGGPPHGKIPTLQTGSTPTGRFKLTGKFVTSAMISPSKLVHSAVPFAQNFSGPYALHGAYWHNDWGELKSGGCINLSPNDAKWLFDFTEPVLPKGWHGVRWLPKQEAATLLIVRR